MAVLVTIRLDGMSAGEYDQINAQVKDKLAGARGFIIHAAVLSSAGVNVTEIWESAEKRREWLEENFELPAGAQSSVEEVEVYNLERG
jgi:heme-degrading monooxygenase HmoA